MQRSNMMEFIAKMQTKSKAKSHPMVVIGRSIYIIDGDTLYRYTVPPRTLWTIILEFLGIKK